MSIALWVLQGVLAVAFLGAGFTKATQPIPTLAKQMTWAGDLPQPFVRFIGVAEILGAIGLIGPGIARLINPAFASITWLTIAAAGGLAIAMISAVVFHIQRKESQIAPAIVLLLLSLLVFVGRLTLAPLS